MKDLFMTPWNQGKKYLAGSINGLSDMVTSGVGVGSMLVDGLNDFKWLQGILPDDTQISNFNKNLYRGNERFKQGVLDVANKLPGEAVSEDDMAYKIGEWLDPLTIASAGLATGLLKGGAKVAAKAGAKQVAKQGAKKILKAASVADDILDLSVKIPSAIIEKPAQLGRTLLSKTKIAADLAKKYPKASAVLGGASALGTSVYARGATQGAGTRYLEESEYDKHNIAMLMKQAGVPEDIIYKEISSYTPKKSDIAIDALRRSF